MVEFLLSILLTIFFGWLGICSLVFLWYMLKWSFVVRGWPLGPDDFNTVPVYNEKENKWELRKILRHDALVRRGF